MTILVLPADDQTLLRTTFRIPVGSCEDTDVVAEATDGLAATASICADALLDGNRTVASGEVLLPPGHALPHHARFDKTRATTRNVTRWSAGSVS
ncbi:hypothetical protein [Streptomyces mirabilis]|uniref:hypothetical protein n=1 Tax=Streptomyces mirabilis TaxID=68239 RepID=UPI003D9F7C15